LRLPGLIFAELTLAATVFAGGGLGLVHLSRGAREVLAVRARDGRGPAPLSARKDLSALPDPVIALEATGTFLGMSDELLLQRVRTQPIVRFKVNHGGSSLSFRIEFADGYDYYQGENFGSDGFVLRWTNGSWRAFTIDEIVATHAVGLDLYYFGPLWVAGHDDVWIGGPTDFIGSTMDVGVYAHYDGSSWKIVGGTYFEEAPSGFWGTGNDIWMGLDGGTTLGSKGPSLLRYLNGAWTSVVIDALPWRSETLSSVWGRSSGGTAFMPSRRLSR